MTPAERRQHIRNLLKAATNLLRATEGSLEELEAVTLACVSLAAITRSIKRPWMNGRVQ
jgi:hypothetical protein